MRTARPSRKGAATATPLLLFGLIGLYIVLQFAWWAWLLIRKEADVRELQRQLVAEGVAPLIPMPGVDRTAWMVAGEGGVFLVLLLIALWLIHRTVKHELDLARQQREFLLATSHELRTPIAALKLHMQTLERDTLALEHREALMGYVRTDVERLQTLTEKILLATRLDEHDIPLAPERTEISSVLRSVVAQAEASYARGHRLVLEVADDQWLITDPAAFRSVITNLLENACKYAPEGTAIDVTWSRSDRSPELRVSDRGPGVAEADRDLIFRKFHRSGTEETRDANGTGLGLFIVDRLMRTLGGRIRYLPRPGGGAIFAASFPDH